MCTDKCDFQSVVYVNICKSASEDLFNLARFVTGHNSNMLLTNKFQVEVNAYQLKQCVNTDGSACSQKLQKDSFRNIDSRFLDQFNPKDLHRTLMIHLTLITRLIMS